MQRPRFAVKTHMNSCSLAKAVNIMPIRSRYDCFGSSEILHMMAVLQGKHIADSSSSITRIWIVVCVHTGPTYGTSGQSALGFLLACLGANTE